MTQLAPRRSQRGAASARRIAVGRRLFSRYRVERRIGRGGTADVWLARDARLDRTVAIKVPHADLLPDAAARERFVDEARAAAGLSHPAIVPVYDVVEDPGMPAIVLRYVDGETLADRIEREGRLAPRDAATIAADIAGALGHAHAAGIVHRDVKPGNVLIDGEGRVQLVDFGIAHSLLDVAPPEAARGLVAGTLRYMAPEQVTGGTVDGRSDLYALGLVLVEMLTGRPLFHAATPRELVQAHREPDVVPGSVPAQIRPLVTRLLAVDPGARPSDAGQVEAELRELAPSLGAEPPAIAPTITPGMPAATAGLALAANPAAAVGEGPPPAIGERDTLAIPVARTAAFTPASGPARRRAEIRWTQPKSALALGLAAVVGAAALVLAAGVGKQGATGMTAASSGSPAPVASASPGPRPSPTRTPLVAPAPVGHKGPPPKKHGPKGKGRGTSRGRRSGSRGA